MNAVLWLALAFGAASVQPPSAPTGVRLTPGTFEVSGTRLPVDEGQMVVPNRRIAAASHGLLRRGEARTACESRIRFFLCALCWLW